MCLIVSIMKLKYISAFRSSDVDHITVDQTGPPLHNQLIYSYHNENHRVRSSTPAINQGPDPLNIAIVRSENNGPLISPCRLTIKLKLEVNIQMAGGFCSRRVARPVTTHAAHTYVCVIGGITGPAHIRRVGCYLEYARYFNYARNKFGGHFPGRTGKRIGHRRG